MRAELLAVVAAAILALGMAPAAAQDDLDACAALNALSLPDLESLTAAHVPAGPLDVPATGPAPANTASLPTFCRVRGVVAPAIGFEVWLPEPEDWNGRFEAVGGGGFAGVISYGAMVPALQAGYVTASTDTGHTAPDLDWLSDPRALRDYGYRAIYEMTSKAKALVRAYYDRGPDYSYFNGCSTGGRQGLMEAQRFPGDYDGIVSGAPVNHFVATHYTQIWVALATKAAADDSILSAADLQLVNDAVLGQCDALDGVEDGVLEDPSACGFDPGILACVSGASEGCLDAAQIAALRKIYSGPEDPATHERLHRGFARGGEPGWLLVTAPGLAPIPQAYFSRSIFGDTSWNWRGFDFAADVEHARAATGELLDATSSDLGAFRDHGGKLILYHGWSDQLIPPEGTIDYYERIEAALPGNAVAPQTSDFARLFMVPGMTHCRGGPGTDRFDAQAAIEAWVERGVPPARLEAAHVENGRAIRTRPLCPYPQEAVYDGSGSTDDADNFVCR